MTDRTAPADHPIHPLLAARWSPRAYTGEPLTAAQVASLLEAGRWAASCFNEQPWNFVLARRDEEPEGFARLLGLLTPGNQAWAGRAGMLMVTVTRLHFAANGNANAAAFYDLGQAVAQMVLQAAALGLGARQMRGFDVERARVELGIPDGHLPLSAVAFGVIGSPSLLSEVNAAKEVAPRARRPFTDFAHAAAWGGVLTI